MAFYVGGEQPSMRRRTFLAGVGGGALSLVGVGAFGSDGQRAGPDFGPVSTPPSAGSTTLDNGRRASLYEEGDIAFLGASLVNQHSGVPAVVGRLKNVSGSTIRQVRVEVQFLDDSGTVLVQGWVAIENLADGEAWQFTASYPGDPDRLGSANVATINAD